MEPISQRPSQDKPAGSIAQFPNSLDDPPPDANASETLNSKNIVPSPLGSLDSHSSEDSGYHSVISPDFVNGRDACIQYSDLSSKSSPPVNTLCPSDPNFSLASSRLDRNNSGNHDDSDVSKSTGPTVSGVVAMTPRYIAQATRFSGWAIQPSTGIVVSSALRNQKTRTFPRLGFNITEDTGAYTHQASPENRQSPSRASHTTATDLGSSPTGSDLSSSGWTEDGQDAETLRIISISSNVLVSVYTKRTSTYTSKGYVSGETGGSSSCKAPERQTSQTQTSKFGRKRKMSRSNTSSDGFDDNGDPKRQKPGQTQPTHAESDILPLACPFNKYDSVLFGPDSPEEAYHACATCSFVNIAHLKQHLQRNHYMPKYYCFRCCSRFTSQAMAASHMRRHPPCETLEPPLYGERISPDMIEDLGLDRKNPPGTDRIAYWHRIYNAFFPGAADRRPVSPYYEGPAAQHMGRFLRFSRPAIRDLLPVVQRRLGLDWVLPGHHLVRLMEEILEDATQRYLQQLTGLGAFQIGQADSFTTIDSIVASQPELASSNAATSNESGQLASIPPRGPQEGSRESSQPSISAASMTSGSTTESPKIPRTPSSAIAPSGTLERSTATDRPSTQDLPAKPIDSSGDLFSFDATIGYSNTFNWEAELDSMEGFDWDSFCPDVVDD
ncbi:MAG: hypothetical protein Q9160_005229 [Pyrenula sp. 1 TL-2023]